MGIKKGLAVVMVGVFSLCLQAKADCRDVISKIEKNYIGNGDSKTTTFTIKNAAKKDIGEIKFNTIYSHAFSSPEAHEFELKIDKASSINGLAVIQSFEEEVCVLALAFTKNEKEVAFAYGVSLKNDALQITVDPNTEEVLLPNSTLVIKK